MKKILIVDDSMFTRNIHRQIIESGGYETIEAANGTQALTLFESENPDVVVTDLLMPDMDGIDVLKKIMETSPDANVIICSTDKQKFRMIEAKEAGAAAFIPKPVDPETLLETLKHLV